jgi:hypothetical protein
MLLVREKYMLEKFVISLHAHDTFHDVSLLVHQIDVVASY